jgi:hypothetical protein
MGYGERNLRKRGSLGGQVRLPGKGTFAFSKDCKAKRQSHLVRQRYECLTIYKLTITVHILNLFYYIDASFIINND